ncbi:hypothetical protein TorRG33x02_329140 [Trema orientale]|uniref:Uncharacterized protein n=1 Tax=Trema orientale TaxID=63057 RepID=A0A2P5B950_TREOI|nr:hypothetical protein TorRG33x02_329140 [Trema orientale]
MVTDETRGLGAAMAVVDTDKSGVPASLNLALIFKDVIGLDHGKGEFTIGVLIEVSAPQERVFNGGILPIILAHTGISPDWFPTRARHACQPRKHPSFPFYTPPFWSCLFFFSSSFLFFSTPKHDLRLSKNQGVRKKVQDSAKMEETQMAKMGYGGVEGPRMSDRSK